MAYYHPPPSSFTSHFHRHPSASATAHHGAGHFHPATSQCDALTLPCTDPSCDIWDPTFLKSLGCCDPSTSSSLPLGVGDAVGVGSSTGLAAVGAGATVDLFCCDDLSCAPPTGTSPPTTCDVFGCPTALPPSSHLPVSGPSTSEPASGPASAVGESQDDDCECCVAGCPPDRCESEEPDNSCPECFEDEQIPHSVVAQQSAPDGQDPGSGLDDDTIAELLRCCCCDDEASPASFATHHRDSHPSHEIDFSRLFCGDPDHVHTHPHPHTHSDHPPRASPKAPSRKRAPTEAESAPTITGANGMRLFACQWSDCHGFFPSLRALTAHVNDAHLSNIRPKQLPSTSRSPSGDDTGSVTPIGMERQSSASTNVGVLSGGTSTSSTPVGSDSPLIPHPASFQPSWRPAPVAAVGPQTNGGAQESFDAFWARCGFGGQHSHPVDVPCPSTTLHPAALTSSHAVGDVRPALDWSNERTVESVRTGQATASRGKKRSRTASDSLASSTASTSSSSGGSHVCHWQGCGRTFASASDLTAHLGDVHAGSGKSSYTCLWDGCYEGKKPRLGGSSGSDDEGEDEGGDGTGKERKEFGQRQKIMRHLQSHTGDRPFSCDVCGKAFGEQATLVQHKRTHTNEKPYKCPYPGCDRSFALASALTIHKRIHTGSKPFVCPEPSCGAAFAESSNLSKHMRVHTGERPFACGAPGCGRRFKRSDQLARHRKVHDDTPAVAPAPKGTKAVKRARHV